MHLDSLVFFLNRPILYILDTKDTKKRIGEMAQLLRGEDAGLVPHTHTAARSSL